MAEGQKECLYQLRLLAHLPPGNYMHLLNGLFERSFFERLFSASSLTFEHFGLLSQFWPCLIFDQLLSFLAVLINLVSDRTPILSAPVGGFSPRVTPVRNLDYLLPWICIADYLFPHFYIMDYFPSGLCSATWILTVVPLRGRVPSPRWTNLPHRQ